MVMRHWVLSSMAAAALMSTGVGHAGDLHLRVILAGQIAPGVYGQVDLGGEAPPPLVYAEPVMAVPVASPPPPVYLYVPPDHVREWPRYCYQYNACNRPVYFVLSPEFQPGYAPGYYGGDGYYRHEEHHRKHHHDDDEDDDD